MRNKNLFIVLLSIFGAICLYNLVMTGIRLNMESEMERKETAEEKGDYLENNADLYNTAVDNSLSLGLDLKGGMFVTMEIAVEDILNELAGKSKDSTFARAVQSAKQKQKSQQEELLDLFVESLREENKDLKLSSYFAGTQTGIKLNDSDGEVVKQLREEIETVIDNSYTILRNRIDQFGVVSPNIQRIEGSNRIVMELPGVNDPERVRQLLKSTAKLEFWETYPWQNVAQHIQTINNIYKEQIGVVTEGDSASATNASDLASEPQIDPITGEVIAPAEDTAAAQDPLAETADEEQDPLAQDALADTAAAATADTAAGDTSSLTGDDATESLTQEEQEAKFYKENPFFELMRLPDQQSISPQSPAVGYSRVTDTAKVNSILNSAEVKANVPQDLAFYWTAKPQDEEGQYLTLVAIRTTRDGEPPLGGETIVDTRAELDQNDRYAVGMTMNTEGAQIWRNMTTNNVGKSIAIVLDDLVYSYPFVNEPIAGGRSSISGTFTYEEARDLANILKAGKLPARTRIIGEESVGPSLGEDTINDGLWSFVGGFIVVIIFMFLYYGRAGFIADIALIINLFFLMGISSALNVVLTLPGIAGIVLTMGMAVDANVLIYERIREEINLGKSLKGAVTEGFRNAFSAIIDGNITTLLTGIVLFTFGTGPIRGFAVTLMIGIITTLITGLIVTRILMDYYVNRPNAKIHFGSQGAVKFFQNLDYPFIAKRKLTYVVTGALAAVFLVSIFTMGFKLGVDFQGGRQYIVEFNQSVSGGQLDDIRSNLKNEFQNNEPLVKTLGQDNQIMITTSFLVNNPDADDQVQAALIGGLQKSFPDFKTENILKSSIVGPTIARDIQVNATYAVIFSLIVMFLYIFLRFTRWQFGLGALFALSFNVIFVLGIFSVLGNFLSEALPFSVEIDQAFIAAILTIVGYSINDTVIIFDRIREKLRDAQGHADSRDLFYQAIKETLSRTVVTLTTTFLTTLVLFIFGGDVLRGFMLAMMLGIVVGTLSSIFIAAPITLDLILAQDEKKDKVEGASLAGSAR